MADSHLTSCPVRDVSGTLTLECQQGHPDCSELCILNALRCPYVTYVTYVRNAGRGQLSSE